MVLGQGEADLGGTMKVHVTRDGKAIPLTKLGDRHLMNIIRRHRRLAREGVLVCWGVMTGPLAEDVDADMDWLYGNAALRALDHWAYVNEARRRGLLAKTGRRK